MIDELISDILSGKREVAKVVHSCAGTNPPVTITFTDGLAIRVTAREARELLNASDRHSDLNFDTLIGGGG